MSSRDRLARAGPVGILLALLVATRLLPSPVPPEIYGSGAVVGGILAVGIVLVYRANRIVNFAQVQLGALAGIFFTQLVSRRVPIVGLAKICPPCVPQPRTVGDALRSADPGVAKAVVSGLEQGSTRATHLSPELLRSLPLDRANLSASVAPGWMVQVSFWLCVAIALVVVAVVSWGVYALLVKRFERSSRLIVTVVTIGLGQVLALFTGFLVPKIFGSPDPRSRLRPLAAPIAFPYKLDIRVGVTTFGTTEIAAVAVAVVALVGLTIFFRRSPTGLALRGASENPQRAESLGINIGSVNGLIWVMAGGLSGIVSILNATKAGIARPTLSRLLAVAVIAGLASIPLAVAGGLVLGIFEQSVLYTIQDAALVDGAVLGIIVLVLLVQRSARRRTDADDDGWRTATEMRPIPTELRGLEVVARWIRSARGGAVAVALAVPWLLSPSQTNLAAVTLIYAIVALSLLILTGWAGQISLGHFAFAAIGAYVTAVVGWPFPFSIIAAGLAGAGAAVVVGLPALRLRGLHLAISTLAFAVAVPSILLNPRYFGKALPAQLTRPAVVGLDLDDQRTFYYFVLFTLSLVLAATIGMRRGRIARALIATRDNDASAQSFGINLLRARLTAFAVSGFIASVAGGLYAYSQYGVNSSSFGVDQSIKMFLMVVIGGLGSVAGPLIGAVYVGLSDILSQEWSFLTLASTGVGVVALLLFAPGGLGEVAYKVRDAMLRRVADRHRIEVPSLVADRDVGLGPRAPIDPKARAGGGTIFVPSRYRVHGQWAVERRRRERLDV
jgi:branched-chain amino acid transport system permease protein